MREAECDHCGLCCELKNCPSRKFGVCEIYNNRPNSCRVEKQYYMSGAHETMEWDEYCVWTRKGCKLLQLRKEILDNMSDKMKSYFTQYVGGRQ